MLILNLPDQFRLLSLDPLNGVLNFELLDRFLVCPTL